MKKVIKIIAVVMISAVIINFAVYRFGYHVYSIIFFKESEVKAVSDSVYIVPKDNSEVFVTYMEQQGWIFTDQMGKMYIFEKGNEKKRYLHEVKMFYCEYSAVE